MARFEPLILGLWVECLTTVLPQQSKTIFFQFSLTGASGRILTLNFVLWCKCFTTVLPSKNQYFLNFCHFLPLVLGTGFEPSILELWVKFSTTALPRQSQKINFFFNFLLLVPVTWIWTLILGKISYVFYHCATTNGLFILKLDLKSFLNVNFRWYKFLYSLP